MSKDSKRKFHLSMDSRRRLLFLRDELMWLLDEDAKFGFVENDVSSRLGPAFWRVLSLVWCKPLKTVSRDFQPVRHCDCPSVYVREDVYNAMQDKLIHLGAENERLRDKLGLSSSDELSF